MTYVIYDKTTTRIKGKLDGYKTHAAAQTQITRWSKIWFRERYTPLYPAVDRGEDPIFVYAIAEADHFRANIERTVTRVNMMSGKEYTESVNTPLACSPSSETYWSM
jgi:hypothetical protein